MVDSSQKVSTEAGGIALRSRVTATVSPGRCTSVCEPPRRSSSENMAPLVEDERLEARMGCPFGGGRPAGQLVGAGTDRYLLARGSAQQVRNRIRSALRFCSTSRRAATSVVGLLFEVWAGC